AAWKTTGQANQLIKIPARFCRLLNRYGFVQNDFITADSSVIIAVEESPRYLVSLAAEPAIRELDLQPNRVILYPQQKFEIRVTGSDAAGVPAQFQLAALNWRYLGTGGHVDNQGQFYAEEAGSGLLIGSYGALADTIFLEIVNPGTHIIDEFDSAAHWQLSVLNLDSLNTQLSISDAVFSSGAHSARIDYQFTFSSNISSSNYRVYLDTELLLPGQPDSLLIDFYGNGQPHKIRFQFHDAFGEQFIRSISTSLNWKDEWRQAKVSLKNLPGQVDYPLSLNQITIFIGQDNPQNNTTYQGTIFLDRLRAKSTRTTRIDDSEPEPPHQFSLYQNYPNPFNSATIIRYQLQKPQHVILSVFNLSGQQVARLVDQWQEAGEYQLHFDGEDLSSGIYFYRLEAGDFIAVKKMVVLR
ncbi:MAG: T9SS type A sorting domain-containing protein, partial [candidate division KSB1 bacterium]|nr:T9SS type A sorting domain-containing protein [candidate division KSB1 bacterium]